MVCEHPKSAGKGEGQGRRRFDHCSATKGKGKGEAAKKGGRADSARKRIRTSGPSLRRAI